jgi:hypothetical protein
VPADPRFEVVVAGAFAASPRALWAHARTMEGVNAELGPWVHMSVPRALAHRPLEEAPLGAEAFVSTMSLLGLVPFDRHHLVLTSVTPEHGFEERSWSWLQRAWWHDRTITPLRGGCRLVDRVRFTPRVMLAAPLTKRLVRATFVHRHERLRAKFGVLDEAL